MKISDIQKRKMLEDVLIRNKSLSETVKENGYSRRSLERLLARARVHGIENVLHGNAQRRYPRDFKYQVVKYVLDGHTLDRSSVEFNVDYHVVRSWFLRYSKGGVEALTADNRGRKSMGRPKKKASEENSDELKKLRTQNEELAKKLRYAEMENEFLKKLDALVRERIERENGR